MSEVIEYRIRRVTFDENGYRRECIPEGGVGLFLCGKTAGMSYIEDLDFNFQIGPKGKLCISEEMGFVHVYFDSAGFTESDTYQLMRKFTVLLAEYFEEEIEFFRSD